MKRIRRTVAMAASEKELFRTRLQTLTQRPAEEAVFLDIETTGFSRLYDSIYLVGFLYAEQDEIFLEQILADASDEEPKLLQAVSDRWKDFRTCLTYNGEAFDLPFLRKRAEKLYVPNFRVPECSVDLYKRYRAYHSFFGWPDQKLKTLERFLGIDREDPFTGGELIEVYREYARTEDEQLAKALLLHNGEDIENMPALLCIEDFWQTGHTCRVLGACRQGDTLSFELDRQMPMSAEGYEGDKHWIFRAGEARAELRRPLYEGELRYYLPRYQDYYYLPETNEIVHRSLAGRIPASQRRKASRDVCYLSKKGAFWPGREGECGSLRAYRREAKDAAAYYEVDELSAWLQAQKEEELTQWFRSLWK